MTEETEKGTFITLHFSGTEKKFADIDELREFMESEKNAWFWLEKAAVKDANLDQVWAPFSRYFMHADQFIKQCWENLNEGEKQINRKDAKSAHSWDHVRNAVGKYLKLDEKNKQINLISLFINQTKNAVNQGVILAETPIACFILDLKDKKSPQIAGYALVSLNKKKVGPFTSAAYEGAYWAMMCPKGSATDFIAEQRKIYNSVSLVWVDRFKKQHDDLGEKNRRLISQIAEQQEQSESLTEIIDNQVADQIDYSRKMRAETKEKLVIFEESFRKKIELQVPVESWSTKHIQHKTATVKAALFTLFLAITTGVTIIGVVLWFHAQFDVKLPEAVLTGDQITKTSILIVISTIGIWLTRLSTKIFISNLHLGMDAGERATMFQTYFALLEGGGLKNEDRQIILETLFRPISTGHIKDDGPKTLPENIIKKFSPK